VIRRSRLLLLMPLTAALVGCGGSGAPRSDQTFDAQLDAAGKAAARSNVAEKAASVARAVGNNGDVDRATRAYIDGVERARSELTKRELVDGRIGLRVVLADVEQVCPTCASALRDEIATLK
jgi:hypothetical protein